MVAVTSIAGMAQTKIVIKGSDTVLPLAQKEAETYMKKNSGKSITVVGGGSGVGLAALIDNSTDIAMASRKIKMDERMKMQDAGRAFKEVTIANDALSVVVNPQNKVSKLTREQLEGIFTGKIKNWKEVGGDDMEIVVYSRETSSGTYEFFKENVMNHKELCIFCVEHAGDGSNYSIGEPDKRSNRLCRTCVSIERGKRYSSFLRRKNLRERFG